MRLLFKQCITCKAQSLLTLITGLGGGFKNAKELRVMNYKEAVNGPDNKRWKAEVKNEYWQMLANKVFEIVL